MKIKLILAVSAFTIIGSICFQAFYTQRIANYSERNSISDKTQDWAGALAYYNKIKADPATGKVSYADIQKAKKSVKDFARKKSRSAKFTWEEVGPDNVGGRTRAILVDRSVKDGSRIYAGGASGGLYVSTNGAGLWEPVDDLAENLIISCIAQAPNGGTIYFGTGCSFESATGFGGSGFLGSGMYSLEPGGSTYTKITAASPIDTNRQGSEWTEINRIAIAPSGRIFAAQNRGLYFSDDDGKTWENPVFKAPGVPNTDEGQDIKISNDGKKVYVSLGGVIYKSDQSGDSDTFTKVSQTSTFPKYRRLELGLAPSNNDYLYALAVRSVSVGVGGGFGGIYRSKDAGKTWSVLIPEEFEDPFGDNAQGYYDALLGVNPLNENDIFYGGVTMWRWDGQPSRITHESRDNAFSGNYIHSDKHSIEFDPFNPGVVYVGTDGGISKSTDHGVTFLPSNRGYSITQMYGIAYDSDGAVMGGTQDNSTPEVTGKGGFTPQEGEVLFGGDGFDCDYSQITNVSFVTSQFGSIARRVADGGFAEINATAGGPFHNVIRLWETHQSTDSKDSVSFTAESGLTGHTFSSGTGDGIKKKFKGSIPVQQSTATVVPGSVSFEVSGQILTDDDGDGELTGDGEGTINYTTNEFEITFEKAPGNAVLVRIFFSEKYPAGSEISLTSNTPSVKVGKYPFIIKHTLANDLNPGETVVEMDPVQSLLAFGTQNAIYFSRNGLRVAEDMDWIRVPKFTGTVGEMEFSKDGKYLFFNVNGGSAGVYRMNNINELYTSGDVSKVTVTKIMNNLGQTVIGLTVDPNDAEHVIVTLGNYNKTNHVYRSTTAVSTNGTNSFTSIQGNLPPMPVYDALIASDGESILVGTEFGVYSSSVSNPASWTDESGTMAHVPVYDLRQQIMDWKVAGNHEMIYVGTHGRGIWKSGTLVGINTPDHGDFSDRTISNLKVYPNPIKSNGTITFELAEAVKGSVKIFDLNGRLIKEVNQQLIQGINTVSLTDELLTVGVYFVRVETTSEVKTAKFVVSE